MIIASAGNFGISFLLELLGLVIVAFLIWKYVAPPLNRVMAKRLETIRAQLAAGDEARAEAARLVQERKDALAKATEEAAQIVERAKKSAELLVEDGARRADEEHDRIVGRIDYEIEAARSRAREEILSELGAVVVFATEAVIRAELTEPIHHQLIDEAIAATETQSTGVVA